MNTAAQIQILKSFITKKRFCKMQNVLDDRIGHIALGLEDIYQPHNASATLRSADAFGVQNVHIIEHKNSFSPNKGVDIGASSWLSLHKYKNKSTKEVFECIKSKGYRIVALSPDAKICMYDFDILKKPSVFFFGSELNGLTNEALQMCDESIYIPMYGFVQSFNISVCVAILLSYFVNIIRSSSINWRLSKKEQEEICLYWLKRIKNSEKILSSKL